jgi:MerR family transcriptional regulator, light-induced transcriptional regulator
MQEKSNLWMKGVLRMDKTFGSRLRYLRKSKMISQQELAGMLDITQTSIANYENNARFPNDTTLIKLADYFQVSLDYLLGRTEESIPFIPDSLIKEKPEQIDPELSRLYLDSLINIDVSEAWRIIETVSRHGVSNQHIFDQILLPALTEAGTLWQKGELDIAQEHFISNETERFITLLRQNPTVVNSGSLIVSLAAGTERHNLGIRMVNNALEEAGYTVMYLGSQIPFSSLKFILDHHPVKALAMTASLRDHINELVFIIKNIREDEKYHPLRIIVGGQAFFQDPDLWKSIGADAYAENAVDAVKSIREMLKKDSR